jgi:hypothetical protein
MYAKPQGKVSHAQRFLISLIEKRAFTGTLVKDWKVPRKFVMGIYRCALGSQKPTSLAVFGLRKHIRPSWWYYEESETLPCPVDFNEKYPAFGPETNEKILTDETVGIRKIIEIKNERKLARYCLGKGIKYGILCGCIQRYKSNAGKIKFHRRPDYFTIKSLREDINPDLWFIFPDELA